MTGEEERFVQALQAARLRRPGAALKRRIFTHRRRWEPSWAAAGLCLVLGLASLLMTARSTMPSLVQVNNTVIQTGAGRVGLVDLERRFQKLEREMNR